MTSLDAEVRLVAFNWLSQMVENSGDVISRQILAQGFQFRGTRVRLLGPQGIFKPAILPEIPLSITTAPKGPYDDSFAPDGFFFTGIEVKTHSTTRMLDYEKRLLNKNL